MTFAKIRIESRDECAKALHGLMQRGRVTVLRDQVFIVPAPALEWLSAEHLSFTLLETLHHDDVVQTSSLMSKTRQKTPPFSLSSS